MLTVQSPEWATAFWPAENLLVFQQATGLVLWNMDTDCWAKFEAGGSAKQLDFCSGNIVLLHDHGMSISKVPPLHPRLPNDYEPPTVHSTAANPPVTHVPLRESLSNIPVMSMAAVSFHWRPYAVCEGLNYFIDVFVEGGGGPDVDQERPRGGCEILHYRYQPAPSSDGDSRSPSHIPVYLAKTPLPQTTWRDLGMAKSVWITNEDVVYFWQDGEDVEVGATRVAEDGQAECVLKTLELHEFDLQYEACPFLGRVCLRSESDMREIAVLDFLEGPPLRE
ncbi:hypothetical protein HWV62_23719 [Athelia sp. TMB]|nr:hypothetical protein HWV62_23719 [Athelia sp. TMB]